MAGPESGRSVTPPRDEQRMRDGAKALAAVYVFATVTGLASRALLFYGQGLAAAADGEAALAALSGRGPFDLLIADIVMPGLDGIELARRATELKPGLRVMFITGFAGVTLSGG